MPELARMNAADRILEDLRERSTEFDTFWQMQDDDERDEIRVSVATIIEEECQ